MEAYLLPIFIREITRIYIEANNGITHPAVFNIGTDVLMWSEY